MLSFPVVSSDVSTYIHVNSSHQMQIVRLLNGLIVVAEKLAFPGERFLFEVTADAELEIVSYDSDGLNTKRIVNLA